VNNDKLVKPKHDKPIHNIKQHLYTVLKTCWYRASKLIENKSYEN